MSSNEIVHEPERSRFVLRVDGTEAGLLEYTLRGDTAEMYHTRVFPEFGGRGGGAALAHTALEHARAAGWKVLPTCSFVAGYLDAHKEYADLVA